MSRFASLSQGLANKLALSDALDFHETDIADGQGFGIPLGVYSKQDGWGFHVIIYGSNGISVRRFSN